MSTNPRYANGHRRRRLRLRVLAAYTHCGICHEVVDKTLPQYHPYAAEVDEILPVSRGGNPLLWSNVRLSHRRCNQWKGNKLDEELAKAPTTRTMKKPVTSRDWRTRASQPVTSREW